MLKTVKKMRLFTMVFPTFLLFSCATQGDENYDLALKLQENGKTTEAKEAFKNNCFSEKHPESCYQLSKLDKENSSKYLWSACEFSGHLNACVEFAELTKDKGKAQKAYSKACETQHVIISPKTFEERLAELAENKKKMEEIISDGGVAAVVAKTTKKVIDTEMQTMQKAGKYVYEKKEGRNCSDWESLSSNKKKACEQSKHQIASNKTLQLESQLCGALAH